MGQDDELEASKAGEEVIDKEGAVARVVAGDDVIEHEDWTHVWRGILPAYYLQIKKESDEIDASLVEGLVQGLRGSEVAVGEIKGPLRVVYTHLHGVLKIILQHIVNLVDAVLHVFKVNIVEMARIMAGMQPAGEVAKT